MVLDWADDEDEPVFVVLIGNIPNALTEDNVRDLIGELKVNIDCDLAVATSSASEHPLISLCSPRSYACRSWA